jgi:hypothetical protein
MIFIHVYLLHFYLCADEFYSIFSVVEKENLVERQSALHKENSGFATPTLGRHISTFRGYRILFSIRNPYINRSTNHFSIHS